MPSPRGQAARLTDMLDAVAGIQAVLRGRDFEGYAADWAARRAVERGLEIISEASRHRPEALKASAPHIPWRQIAGIGNILRHEYQRVEDRLIWNVARDHLDAVEAFISAALAQAPNPSAVTPLGRTRS